MAGLTILAGAFRGRPLARGAVLAAVALLGAAAALLVGPHASRADIYPTASWNCRASVLRVTEPLPSALNDVEPVVANGASNAANPQSDITQVDGPMDEPSCANQSDSLPSFSQPGQLSLSFPSAATSLTAWDPGSQADVSPAPATVPSDTLDQKANASTQLAELALGDASSGLDVRAASAEAHAFCGADGKARFSGSSNVAGVVAGGNDLGLDGALSQVASGITDSGLGALVSIYVNRQIPIKDAAGNQTGLIQRALEVDLIDQGGSAQVALVAGEAKVTASGDTCTAALPPATNTVTSTVANTVTTAGQTTTQAAPAPAPAQTVTTAAPSPGPTRILETVTVPAPTILRPNGENGGCGHLSMRFVVTHSHALTSRFGIRQVARGHIISCTGKPIIHAKIDVFHFINGKRHRLVKTGLRSRGHGRLTLILPRNLTSRTIEFDYRPDLASSRVTSRVVLNLTVLDRTGRILRGPAPGPRF